jgi:hypothetical protein
MLVAWMRRNCRQLVSVADGRGWDPVALEDASDR